MWRKRTLTLTFFSIAVLIASGGSSLSSDMAFAEDLPAGKIANLRGVVTVSSAKIPAGENARVGQILQAGDVISTDATGWVAILLADETTLQLHRNSRFVLKEAAQTAGWFGKRQIAKISAAVSQSYYRLEKGALWLRNKNTTTNIDITTTTATLGIRGTEIELKVGEDGTATLTMIEGLTRVRNEFGAMDARAREQIVARPNAPLAKRVLLTPEDAVQWIIPIPPLFDDRDSSPEVRRAFLRLRAGEVKQAQNMLAEWTAKHPDDSPAWGLYALTAVMLGQKSLATDAAGKAVSANPRSVNSLIIQSYTHQMAFDLDRALEAIRKALSLDEKNVTALIGLARLRFGMDYIQEAHQTLDVARGLSPQDGEVHNLLGFILLAENRSDEAISSFRRAAELDPSLGEPHMGLGIAYMRKGDADLAFEEMTMATLLEPRRSLYLSYWAKMLYQLERFDKALDMLKAAHELDPRDPTPELYSAIVLRDLNRPTESISALNRAIALNDNRAVYRSQFLLDRDLAVKNVDLSILYNQLGLADWAKNKALASVKQDYTNASAHLFLAGALREADDRTWPASGEFLIARMLQPANMNTFNTFNEYTSFFDRPSIHGIAAGYLGNRNYKGGDLTVYGGVPAADLAFGGAVSYSDTDGWRNTNGELIKNTVVMMKWAPTQKDGIMAVVSQQKSIQNDNFDRRYEYSSASYPDDWLRNELTRVELGYHHHFSPNSDFLLYLARLDTDGTIFQQRPLATPLIYRSTTDYALPYYQAQGQYLFKMGNQQLIAGTNQYWGDNNLKNRATLMPPTLVVTDNDHEKSLRLQSYYLQDTWKMTSKVTLEGALYFDRMQNSDSFKNTDWVLNEWGPRVGLIFTPTRTDTFRLAAFRYLLPFFSSRLDPTDVGGVSVFRNNDQGSVIKEGDAVWEHGWSTGYLSTGFFYLEKKLLHENPANANPDLITDDGRMKGAEAVVNQLLWPGMGLSLSYRYKDIRDQSWTDADREDHLARATLKYIHHSGFSTAVSQAYRHERFKTVDRPDEGIWITDAKLEYEFPHKRGAASFEVRNIFNHHFDWTTDNFVLIGRAPAREVIFTLSLNF